MRTAVEAGEALPERRVTITARHVVLGAVASRDWQPQHHDHAHAVAMNLPGIILNTPSQIGWFTGYLTNWTGERARIARWRLEMIKPITPGLDLTFSGVVRTVTADERGFSWMEFSLAARSGVTEFSTARILAAMPSGTGIEPWMLSGEDWRPPAFLGDRL